MIGFHGCVTFTVDDIKAFQKEMNFDIPEQAELRMVIDQLDWLTRKHYVKRGLGWYKRVENGNETVSYFYAEHGSEYWKIKD